MRTEPPCIPYSGSMGLEAAPPSRSGFGSTEPGPRLRSKIVQSIGGLLGQVRNAGKDLAGAIGSRSDSWDGSALPAILEVHDLEEEVDFQGVQGGEVASESQPHEYDTSVQTFHDIGAIDVSAHFFGVLEEGQDLVPLFGEGGGFLPLSCRF